MPVEYDAVGQVCQRALQAKAQFGRVALPSASATYCSGAKAASVAGACTVSVAAMPTLSATSDSTSRVAAFKPSVSLWSGGRQHRAMHARARQHYRTRRVLQSLLTTTYALAAKFAASDPAANARASASNEVGSVISLGAPLREPGTLDVAMPIS